ncbi:hypothetical protein KIPB_000285 [Kipferlia bialata]|uniref:Dolichol kinase n=1 Tax=Kipferlia bialata TaxID=797122 RepID=A0A9K3CNJ7_9EUKA|nr:hypothetical protein KIPB_000285 [Kipferlia bialata]|eukprot:g285.t1
MLFMLCTLSLLCVGVSTVVQVVIDTILPDIDVPSYLGPDTQYLWPCLLTLPLVGVSPVFYLMLRRSKTKLDPGTKRALADTLGGMGYMLVASAPVVWWLLYTLVDLQEVIVLPAAIDAFEVWMVAGVVALLGLTLVLISTPRRCKAPLSKKLKHYPAVRRYILTGLLLGTGVTLASLMGTVAAELIVYPEAPSVSPLAEYRPYGLGAVPFLCAGALSLPLLLLAPCLKHSTAFTQLLLLLSVLVSVSLGAFWDDVTDKVSHPLGLVAVCTLPASLMVLASLLVLHRLSVSVPAGQRGPKSMPWTNRCSLTSAHFMLAFVLPQLLLNPFSDPLSALLAVFEDSTPASLLAEGPTAYVCLCAVGALGMYLVSGLRGVYTDAEHVVVPVEAVIAIEEGRGPPRRRAKAGDKRRLRSKNASPNLSSSPVAEF